MASSVCPGQSLPLTTLRSTKLLDLPNELLSRIIDFLVPRHVLCPATVRHTPRDGSIGLTCIRLFKLMRKRFLNLDFVYPRSLNDISHIPCNISRNVELFTRVASPFAEVLRLPTDFCPKDPALTSLGWCPHLRELCVTMNEDPSHQMDMEQYFIGHKKLEVLTLHTPGKRVLEALAYASLRIRKLTLVTLQCSGHTLQVLDSLLSTMSSLESLTISFQEGTWKTHYPPRLRRYLTLDPQDYPYLTEAFVYRFSQILRRNYQKLTALRKLSFWTGTRAASLSPNSEEVYEDGNMANIVRLFAFYVDNARELAFDSPPDLKLHKLRLRMYKRGAPILEGFMQGLVDASTEVIIHSHRITVCYPALVDQSNPPLPVITRIRFDDEDDDDDKSFSSDEESSSFSEEKTVFYKKYSMLQRCADFKLESIAINTKDSARLLLRETNRELLPNFLKGNDLKSLMFNYFVNNRSDLKMTMKLLQVVSSFAHNIRELALPRSFMLMSEVMTTKDLAQQTFANSLRVLRLFHKHCVQTKHRDFREYEAVHLHINDDSDILLNHAEILAERLPEFLEKLRRAFPNLTHLCMDPVRAQSMLNEDIFHWMTQTIEKYERQTGVDASSLRAELQTWT